MAQNTIELKAEMRDLLKNNILSFWMNKMVDNTNGGFYGRMNGNNQLLPDADKGAVLNARILWTFSSAYRLLKDEKYLTLAMRARDYILENFYDKEMGGVYWSVNYKGEPVDTKKQIYALGFALYGMSELYRATGDQAALNCAISLFKDIEKHSFDPDQNGYFEALTRNWHEIEDMRLSTKDANEKKTMNTHLHILEPYTNLHRVWKNEELTKQLKNLIEVFLDKIVDAETGHLKLFFDENWVSKGEIFSYGHDIEASWLIHEAALELGDAELLARVEKVVPQIARAASEGLCKGGGMAYERDVLNDHLDADKHSWVQAESVLGYINLYQHFGDEDGLNKALDMWQFIKDNLVDNMQGEWYWSRLADGSINRKDDKAGFWKCPYHNSRMCLEVMERF